MSTSSNIEFWENNHNAKNRFWLTNSIPSSVYKIHKIEHLVNKKDMNILEIGVGFGDSIRFLSKSHNVYAVDISNKALERVEDVSTTIQSYEPWVSDTIDLAICHLVFQHCGDDDIRHLMKQTINSLKDDGLFSFQSAYVDTSKLDSTRKQYVAENHLYFRTVDEIKSIVDECGGEVVWVSDKQVFPNACGIEWNIFHIRGKK